MNSNCVGEMDQFALAQAPTCTSQDGNELRIDFIVHICIWSPFLSRARPSPQVLVLHFILLCFGGPTRHREPSVGTASPETTPPSRKCA